MLHQLLRWYYKSRYKDGKVVLTRQEDPEDQASLSPSNSVYDEVIPLTAYYLNFTIDLTHPMYQSLEILKTD